MTTNSFRAYFQGGQLTLRFSSLPGCKLSGSLFLAGLWLNGVGAKSGYYPEAGGSLTWSEDGASCALNGKKEVLTYNSGTNPPAWATVTDLAAPTGPIIVR